IVGVVGAECDLAGGVGEMGAFEIVRKSVQIGGVDLELAHVAGDVFVELLAALYQFVLQLPDFVPGRIVAVDAGTMVVAQGSPQIIRAGGIELGTVERRQDVVHLFVERNVRKHAADFLFTHLGGIAKRLVGMHLFGQAGAIFGIN